MNGKDVLNDAMQSFSAALAQVISETMQQQMRTLAEVVVQGMQQKKDVLTLKEAADYMGLVPKTVRELAADGKLAFSKQGRQLYFMTKDVIAYMMENRNDSSAEIKGMAAAYCLQHPVQKRKRA